MLLLVPKIKTPSKPEVLTQRQQGFQEQKEPYKPQFLVNFQEISANLFNFYAQDTLHDLSCSFSLDIQDIFVQKDLGYEDDYLIPMVVCNFPAIDGQMLHEKVFGNEYLQGILLVRFYLSILESLFLFCDNQDAYGLVLTVDENALSVIEVFRPFLLSEHQVMTEKGKQTEGLISTNVEAYDDLLDLIDKIDQDFRQTLWRDQRENQAIREYLKNHALSVL